MEILPIGKKSLEESESFKNQGETGYPFIKDLVLKSSTKYSGNYRCKAYDNEDTTACFSELLRSPLTDSILRYHGGMEKNFGAIFGGRSRYGTRGGL